MSSMWPGALASHPGLGLARRAGWANEMARKSKPCSETTLTPSQRTGLCKSSCVPFVARKSQCQMYPRGAEGWRSKVAFGALRLRVGSTQLSLPGQWKGQMMPAGSVVEIVEIMGGQKAVLNAFQHLSQHCRFHCWGARMRAAVQVWSGVGGVRSHTFQPLETHWR